MKRASYQNGSVPNQWAIDLQCRLNELEEQNRWIPVSEFKTGFGATSN